MTAFKAGAKMSHGSENSELESLLDSSRKRLRHLVSLRMDHRIAARVDPSDVIQEAFVEATQRFEDFRENQECSPFIWLRFITLQKIAQLHRTHMGVQARTVAKERSLAQPDLNASSILLADRLMSQERGPGSELVVCEQKEQLVAAVEGLKEADREIIAMRHFEMLTNAEVASIYQITEDTAYRRYLRALTRLRTAMKTQADLS